MASSIIFTEYDVTLRSVLRSALCADGHIVDSFRSGLEAIECAQRRRADLVILDGLPEAKGLEACACLRQLDAYAGVPIVVTTWNASAEFRREAERAGLSKLLVKPFSKSQFLASVHDFVGLDEETDARFLARSNSAVAWRRLHAPS